ncbi:MAG TPA: hypothetical protein VGC02_01665 [Methanobacterium sp.]
MLSGKKDIRKLEKSRKQHSAVTTAYGSGYFKDSIPKFEITWRVCLHRRPTS